MSPIAGNLQRIREEIAAAAERAGRSPGQVRLVVVTKTVTAADARRAFQLGCRDFGENRVSEAQAKISELSDLPIRWHGIGTIQTNKAARAVRLFDLIHSVHSFHTGEALARAAERMGKRQEILLQINVGREPQKHGIAPEETLGVAEQLEALPGLRLAGLMCMAPLAADPETVRPCFRELRQLRDRLAGQYPQARELSMGMSQDYAVAVEEGATLVRIGSALFAP